MLTRITRRGSCLTRNRATKIVALCGAVMFVFSRGAVIGGSTPSLILHLGTYGLYALVGALFHHLSWNKPAERPAKIRVEGGALWVDDVCVRRAGRLVAARVLPRAQGGPMVELRRRFDLYPLRIALRTLDDARAIVRAMGLDDRDGATRFPMPLLTSPVGMTGYIGTGILLMVAMGRTSSASASLGPLLPMVFLAFLSLPRLLRGSLTIGDEGMLFESRIRRRFLAFADVVGIERVDAGRRKGQPMVSPGFRVTMRHGEMVTVPTLHERLGASMYQEDHVFEAARAAWASTRGERRQVINDLLRGQRSFGEWLHSLRAPGSYRAASESDGQLRDLLADPAASAEERLGAAIRLRARGAKGTKRRIRAAADSSVTPLLRLGLEAVATGDDARLVQLLTQAEQEPE